MPIILEDPDLEVGTEIVLDPLQVATSRVELHLNAGAIRVAPDGPDWGDAEIAAHMAEQARGEIPVEYRTPNRKITIPLLLGAAGAASFSGARRQLQAKASLFQREGGWIKRGTGLYADIVNATLKLPDKWGHLGVEADVILTLEALPDFYGDEITLDAITETANAELVAVLKKGGVQAVIAGDHPGRARIVVTELDGDMQRGLFWGWRSRHYDPTSTARLAYEAEALTPLDSAALASVTGASGGSVVQHASLSTGWTPVLSTQILGGAQMTHRGSYRVRARVRSEAHTPRVRLLWDVGDLTSPTANAAARVAVAGHFLIVDLGEIRLDPAPVGTHRWHGVIQAAGDAGGEGVQIDKLWLAPIDDGHGWLVAEYLTDPGLFGYTARDEFNHAAGALVGKVAPLGGTWSGTGDSDDFALNTTDKTAQRTAVSDTAARLERLGTGTLTDVAVQADIRYTGAVGGTDSDHGVFARYVDATNHAEAHVGKANGTTGVLRLFARGVSGSPLASVAVESLAGKWYTLRLTIDSTGTARVWHVPQGSEIAEPLITITHTAFATGGALASGGYGLRDYAPDATAITRDYDNVGVWVPGVDAVLHASRRAELRTDGVVREAASGGSYGPVTPFGDLPRIPPSGIEERPVELLLKASRGDLAAIPDSGIDDLSVQVIYRPSWLNPL